MENLQFDLSADTYYLIDTSYVMYFIANSAFNEYAYSNDIRSSEFGPDFDPTIDQEYCIVLKEMFHERIENLIKKLVPFRYDKTKYVFSLDCPRAEIWRRDLYPEYKSNRDTRDRSKDKFNQSKVFNYMKNVIVKSFCEENGSISIDSACAESDDIIAVLTRRLTNAGKYVIIVSSDRDMVQLCNDHVVLTTLSEEVRNPKRELLKLTKTKEIDEDITPSDFLLFKIILGDPSDSIPSIKRGVGPKTALKIILDKSKKQLKNLMKEDNVILESFKRNKALIAMSEIPSEITSSIIERYDNIISEQRNA